MEVAGTTQIGVIDDGAGTGGGPGGFVIGDERCNALAGQPADLDGAGRDGLGAIAMEIPIKAQNAQACPEALFGMRPVRQNGDDQPLGLRPNGSGPSPEAVRCPLGVATVRTGPILLIFAVAPAPLAAPG